MRYKLLRRSSLEQIDNVMFPASVRNPSGTWTVMAQSNSYDVILSLFISLGPRDQFKITEAEVPT